MWFKEFEWGTCLELKPGGGTAILCWFGTGALMGWKNPGGVGMSVYVGLCTASLAIRSAKPFDDSFQGSKSKINVL